MENKFVAVDVHIANEGHSDANEGVCQAKVEEVELGFGMDNE
jgi:hypothetical protein